MSRVKIGIPSQAVHNIVDHKLVFFVFFRYLCRQIHLKHNGIDPIVYGISQYRFSHVAFSA